MDKALGGCINVCFCLLCSSLHECECNLNSSGVAVLFNRMSISGMRSEDSCLKVRAAGRTCVPLITGFTAAPSHDIAEPVMNIIRLRSSLHSDMNICCLHWSFVVMLHCCTLTYGTSSTPQCLVYPPRLSVEWSSPIVNMVTNDLRSLFGCEVSANCFNEVTFGV